MAPPMVVGFGGGLDGTAMLIEMYRRGLRPDLIQFADTGNRDKGPEFYGEKPETYAHVDRMDRWCREKWDMGITWVRNDGMYGTLENNCIQRKMLPSICYGFKSCSDKYKRRPQEKYLKTWQPAVDCWASGGKVLKIIGYNADEWHRQSNIVEDKYFTYRYFLIEWGITRRMCREIALKELGYVPIKSACYFCGSSKKSEILWLHRVHPEIFNRAVAIEQNVNYSSKDMQIDCPECDSAGCNICDGKGYFVVKGNTVVGLGRNWSWQDIVRADENQFKLFDEPPDLPCMCFDGGDSVCEL